MIKKYPIKKERKYLDDARLTLKRMWEDDKEHWEIPYNYGKALWYEGKYLEARVLGDDAKEIIIGYPINMDGSIGVRAIDAEKFSQKIKESSGIEVKLWDERLSTKEAENFMIKASVTRKKRKKVIDKLAAVIILQGYLDSR